jgi:prepilin-type N-terminal cleavage/methylation domain-containing protein
MHGLKKYSSGFTLIEILVTLAIFIVLGGIVLLNISGKRSTVDLTNTSEQIASTLREAQSDAMAQKNNASWGVRFSNTTTSFYALFSGSYATGTIAGKYTLPNDVQFDPSSVTVGSFVDVTFAQVTGIPSASTSIVVDLISGETANSSSSSSTVSITRQSSGKIFFDNFGRSSL